MIEPPFFPLRENPLSPREGEVLAVWTPRATCGREHDEFKDPDGAVLTRMGTGGMCKQR
jgi:hypothetical protein